MFHAVRQIAINISTAVLLLATVIYRHVVNLVTCSAFCGHLQGSMQQRKIW